MFAPRTNLQVFGIAPVAAVLGDPSASPQPLLCSRTLGSVGAVRAEALPFRALSLTPPRTRLTDRIVDEEVALHARVRRHLEQRTEKPRDDERSLERELELLREQIVSGRERKDQLALSEQWHRQ